ncbi:heparinase II/III-like protein [Psychrobacter immobilis]|uniref:Heparinase II/III-like protein n=1 Tax=Psychrobacter immobilis TaxID=498 RepID=A0A2V2A5H3_PSYIM|nr:heparinase II/III family protein [Psychrobacter immobilis]PWK14645.1 heparinase II/III-like protein [Psychrobacter immobilis]
MIKILDDKGVSIFVNHKGTDIEISLNQKRNNCVYACYFHFEDVTVTYHYQHHVNFSHQIDLHGSKLLSIRYFIWDKKKDIRISETLNITRQLELLSTYSLFLDNELSSYLLDKDVENYISTEENIVRGKMLFEDNKLKLTSFAPVEWEEWEANPFDNRSWQWALHWFDFNKYLLAFHHETNNDEVLVKLKKFISSWIDRYLYNDNTDFEFIWHDHATALRAEQILLLLHYLKKYNPIWMHTNFTFVSCLFETLNVLGEKLEEEDFYSRHTNHGLEQVRVLMLLGLILDNKVWVDTSILRLNDELDFSFTSEGVHKENSPGYHQFVFKIFLSIIEEFPSYVLKDLGPKFNDIASKALTYITYILRPDNNLPIIGDTELKPTSDAYRNYFSGTIEYENFLYSLTQGKRGSVPLRNNMVYPKSGYAIFRNTWGNEKDFTDSMHLIFKAGCLSQYHHQQDENNFVLYAFGEDWIIDSGLYNYINKDPIRHYARRRQAHNIPIISNTSYAHTDFDHRMDNWSIYDYSEDQYNPYVSAENTVLQDIGHSRKIEIDSLKSEIKVEDNIICLDDVKRTVIFLLHIPIDKKIEVFDDVIKLSSLRSSNVINLFLSKKPNLIEVKKGVKSNTVNSVVSYIANTYEDSQVIRFTFNELDEIKLKTTIRFEQFK